MSDLKAALQAAQRGNNLVCYAPASPNAVGPLLAALPGEAPWVALAPEEALDEWARAAGRALEGRTAFAHTPARLARHITGGEVRLLGMTPELGLELVRRSTLKLDGVTGVLLLWPEVWTAAQQELLATLLQDLDKSAQRIVISTDPAASADVVERYCWRAAVVDLLGPVEALDVPVRSMPVGWGRRNDAIVDLLEQLDPATHSVWCGGTVEAADLVVAYDLPTPAQLRELAAAGAVVLLAPPGTESYVARLAPKRRPIHEQTALRAASKALADQRRAIADRVDEGASASTYSALAPLLEHYESTRVAAALYELWQAAAAGHTQPQPVPAPTRPAKLWLGVGKRDSVTTSDLVGALIKDAGVSREAIGKVEIRESFALVELAGVDVNAVAERLAGKVIRKRRVVARPDRGRDR